MIGENENGVGAVVANDVEQTVADVRKAADDGAALLQERAEQMIAREYDTLIHMKDSVQDTFEKIKEFFSKMGQGIVDFFKDLTKGTLNVGKSILEKFKEFGKNVKTALTDFGNIMTAGARITKESLQKGLQKIGTSCNNGVTTMREVLGSAKEKIVNSFKKEQKTTELLTVLIDKIKNLEETVKRLEKSLEESLKGEISLVDDPTLSSSVLPSAPEDDSPESTSALTPVLTDPTLKQLELRLDGSPPVEKGAPSAREPLENPLTALSKTTAGNAGENHVSVPVAGGEKPQKGPAVAA